MPTKIYEPVYTNSHAIIVGINGYRHTGSLRNACNDAESLYSRLVEKFGFSETCSALLIEENATKSGILRQISKLTTEEVLENDRVLFFFAGHGHTMRGPRGEVGFLVPQDGKPEEVDSLIAWNEILTYSNLVKAKHLLFIMDACYGGVFFTRAHASGKKRFALDMLQRFSRQAITSGKADEPVTDAGGPIPDHSVFAGHLLEGMDGKAHSKEGVLTATHLMHYVWTHVGPDPGSLQTPHFGHIQGDGDFIFNPDCLEGIEPTNGMISDKLISTAPTQPPDIHAAGYSIERTKALLSDQVHRIELHDHMSDLARAAIERITHDRFSPNLGVDSPADLAKRLSEYEAELYELLQATGLLAFWGDEWNRASLTIVFRRIAELLRPESGVPSALAIRQYALMLLLYTAGVAAVADENYGSLGCILTTQGPGGEGLRSSGPIVSLYNHALGEVSRARIFKSLPGYERNYVPHSEYFYKTLQPLIESITFVGSDYEAVFDRFEMLLCLWFIWKNPEPLGLYIGPYGRFAWKEHRHYGETPLQLLASEVEEVGDTWQPFKEGLFAGNQEAVKDAITRLREWIKTFNWH